MAQDTADITLPPEFSGPAQFILYNRYGDPRAAGWENKWITHWHVKETFPWVPIDKLIIHKHFWPLLHAAFEDLTESGLYQEIKSIDGCYEMRNLNGSDTLLSVHSWGAGIDMNRHVNALGSAGNWSNAFIDTMEKHHIYCGQRWQGLTEPMHFSMVNGS